MSGGGTGIYWCPDTKFEGVKEVTFPDGIGYGYNNTVLMNEGCGESGASHAASRYQGGGLTDWSLPSKMDLQQLFSYPNRDQIGGFVDGYYWSSSGTIDWNGCYCSIWAIDFGSKRGSQDNFQAQDFGYAVRPVRAF
jgi:hypothetical protein